MPAIADMEGQSTALDTDSRLTVSGNFTLESPAGLNVLNGSTLTVGGLLQLDGGGGAATVWSGSGTAVVPGSLIVGETAGYTNISAVTLSAGAFDQRGRRDDRRPDQLVWLHTGDRFQYPIQRHHSRSRQRRRG